MTLYGLAAIAAAWTAFSLYYRRRRVAEAAVFVEHYEGIVTSGGDAIRFIYRDVRFEVRRLASGGGLAGTGSYSVLVMPLSHGTKLDLCTPDSAKYLYALSVPPDHTIIPTATKKVLVVGTDHRSSSSAIEPLAASGVFDRLFSRPFSTLRVQRDLWTLGRWPPRRTWSLQLSGIPEGTYQRPEVLRPVLDGVLALSEALGLHALDEVA